MTAEYPFGLFAGAVAMGLCDGPEEPVALFSNEAAAKSIASRFYGPCAYVERVADVACVDHLSTIEETNQQCIVHS